MEKLNSVQVDVICPIFHVDLDAFRTFIRSWYLNIPIKNLYIGMGKKNPILEQILHDFPNVNIIDQTQHKTLGFCLQELFNKVETEYFVYLHNDVEILLNWFSRIWECRVKGIVESLKDPTFGPEALVQARKYRAYSGAQLIYTEAIKDLGWEDDWIYCSEDIIIRNVLQHRGYTYVKTPIYHKHYRILSKRSQSRTIILEWQFKSILKYSTPTIQLMNYVKGIVHSLNKQYGLKFHLESEIAHINPKWMDLY